MFTSVVLLASGCGGSAIVGRWECVMWDGVPFPEVVVETEGEAGDDQLLVNAFNERSLMLFDDDSGVIRLDAHTLVWTGLGLASDTVNGVAYALRVERDSLQRFTLRSLRDDFATDCEHSGDTLDCFGAYPDSSQGSPSTWTFTGDIDTR